MTPFAVALISLYRTFSATFHVASSPIRSADSDSEMQYAPII